MAFVSSCFTSFFLSCIPFVPLFLPPPLHITTVKWVKVKSLNFRKSSFENRFAICVCENYRYIFWNVTYQMAWYLYVAMEFWNGTYQITGYLYVAVELWNGTYQMAGYLYVAVELWNGTYQMTGCLYVAVELWNATYQMTGYLYVAVEFWNGTYQITGYLYVAVEFWNGTYQMAGYLHVAVEFWNGTYQMTGYLYVAVEFSNGNTKSLAYTSLVRPILEYGAACWDPYRECQINALDRVQNKPAKFAHHSGGSDWESLAKRRKIAWVCAL
jgi:hypothetical protein